MATRRVTQWNFFPSSSQNNDRWRSVNGSRYAISPDSRANKKKARLYMNKENVTLME